MTAPNPAAMAPYGAFHVRHRMTQALGLAAWLLVSAGAAHARPDDESFVVVKAGHIITAAGTDIDDGEIVIVDGKIRLVGRKLEYPATAKIIDAADETVVPGLIDARTRPGSLPDYSRSGVHGDLKAAADVFLSTIDFDPYLHAGFTSIAIYPPGLQVPGVASVYHTAGPESDRLLGVPGYVRMTMNSQPRDKGTLRDAIKKAKSEIERVEKARKDWEAKKKESEAKKKAEGEKPQGEPSKEPAPKPEPAPSPPSPAPPSPPTPQPHPGPGPQPAPGPAPQGPQPPPELAEFKAPEMDAAHRPFIDLLQKKAGAPAIMLEMARASDYLHAADVLKEEKDIRRMYFLGGFPGFADFNYVVARLGDEKALVAMPPYMYRLPTTVTRYNLAGALFEAGAEVAFIPTGESAGDLESYRTRVADLARSGVERGDAVKAMTINAARLIGAEKRLGSIEKGKDADLTFLSGDILDPQSRVTRVMINGEIVWTSEEKR